MKICIVMPVHDKVTPHAMLSMCSFFVQAVVEDHELKFDPTIQCSNLPNARNVMLSEAWSWGADVVMSIDDDIFFKPKDVFTLVTLAYTRDEVFSGEYCHKSKPRRTVGFPVLPIISKEERFQEMTHVGMGFCAFSRNVLSRLREAYPDTYTDESTGTICHALYEKKRVGDLFHSEDKVFCDKWREIGGKIFIDTEVRVGHVGSHVFH